MELSNQQWIDLAQGDLVVHCPSTKHAEDFFKACKEADPTLFGYDLALEAWEDDKEDTCYRIIDKEFWHSSFAFYRRERLPIITWEMEAKIKNTFDPGDLGKAAKEAYVWVKKNLNPHQELVITLDGVQVRSIETNIPNNVLEEM